MGRIAFPGIIGGTKDDVVNAGCLQLSPINGGLIVRDVDAGGQRLTAIGCGTCEDVAVPDVAICIGVAAMAGMGGVTRPRDGGTDDGIGKGVTERLGHRRAVVHIAVGAYVTGVGTRGTGGGVVYAGEVVPVGGSQIRGEGEAAFTLAGIDGIAAFGTGGQGHR